MAESSDDVRPQPNSTFNEGDVEIIISAGKTIRVHSGILKIASRFFSTSMSATWAATNGNSQGGDQDVTWTYRLVLDEEGAEGDIFKRQPKLRAEPSSPASVNTDLGSLVDLDPDALLAHENLFLIYSHRTPRLNTFDECAAVIRLADKYDSLPCVSRAVRLRLLESSWVWQDIARRPAEYLVLAEQMRSPAILKEASTHVIGLWGKLAEDLRDKISSRLFETLRQKKAYLSARKLEIMEKLLLLNIEEISDCEFQRFNMCADWVALSCVREDITNAFLAHREAGASEYAERALYGELLEVGVLYEADECILDSVCGKRWKKYSVKRGIGKLQVLVGKILDGIADVKLNPTVDPSGMGHVMSCSLSDSEIPWDEDWP